MNTGLLPGIWYLIKNRTKLFSLNFKGSSVFDKAYLSLDCEINSVRYIILNLNIKNFTSRILEIFEWSVFQILPSIAMIYTIYVLDMLSRQTSSKFKTI